MILEESGQEPGVPRGVDTSQEQAPADDGADQSTRSAARAAAHAAIDPNYDPAFQRGYQAAPGERTRTRVREGAPAVDGAPFRRPAPEADRSTLAPDALDVDEEASGPDTSGPDASGPDTSGPDTSGPRTVEDPDAALAPAPAIASPAAGSILDRVELSPRRNPYVLALWILGGGFVVLGVAFYGISVYTSYTTGSAQPDLTTLVFSQLGWMLAGPLVTVGLATIVSLVLLTALAGTKRRADPDRSTD